MLIDRLHKRWIVVTSALFVASLGGYLVHAQRSLNPPSGGTAIGLAYGITGTALMLYAAAFGARRKIPIWRLGRAETWLKGHIWLGLLSYPLIWFHAGLSFGGPLTTALMILFTVVVVSGIFGLVVQGTVPRLMTVRVPSETLYEQIDRLMEQRREEARDVVRKTLGDGGGGRGHAKAAAAAVAAAPAEGAERTMSFYVNVVEPWLDGRPAPGGGPNPLDEATSRTALFEQIRVSLPKELHAAIVKLEEICEERRQLLLQKRLHHWLHGWLFIHLPLSVALIVLSAMHAIMALYY